MGTAGNAMPIGRSMTRIGTRERIERCAKRARGGAAKRVRVCVSPFFRPVLFLVLPD